AARTGPLVRDRGARGRARARAAGRALRRGRRARGGGHRERALPARAPRPRSRTARARRRRRRPPARAGRRMERGHLMTCLFADPLPARLVSDEGELTLLQVAGRRFPIVEVMRRWRVEADWWKGGPARDYVTLRTAGGMVCDAYPQ